MDASEWYWVLGIVGALASVVSILIWIMPSSRQRRAAIWAAILLGIVAIVLVLRFPSESISDVTIYAESGTYSVADFLEFLSHGPFRVTMDSRTADELRRRHVKISTSNLKNVSLKYVLDSVLTPQLPGPEQWTYEIVGKTVVVKRK